MRYDENGHPVALTGARQRAEELFDVKFFHIFNMIFDMNTGQAIDKDNDGSLTLAEFLDAYNRMAEILKRQDAIEQKKKLFCLILFGPKIQKNTNFSEVKNLSALILKTAVQDGMISLCERVLTINAGVTVEKDDIAHVELRSTSSSESVFTKSIFIRFHDMDLRYLKNFPGLLTHEGCPPDQDEGLGCEGPC